MLGAPVVPASSLLSAQPLPADLLPTGVPALDHALGGLPRGSLVEICGPRSSGKTALMISALAQATQRGEVCSVVDVNGCFDPASASRSGVVLPHVIWVRCNGNAGAALKAADLLLHGGGLGLVCLDLAGVPVRVLNSLPVSYWYRFRRAVEHTPSILLIVSEHPNARSCAARSIECEQEGVEWSGRGFGRLLVGLRTSARPKKPARASVVFLAKAD